MTREEASYILRKFYANGYRSNDYTTIEQALQLAVMCLENSPRWISVEDELPPKKTGEASDNVLVYDAENNRVGASWYIHSTGKWFNGWDSITHWMPMPAPPKKGGELRQKRGEQ